MPARTHAPLVRQRQQKVDDCDGIVDPRLDIGRCDLRRERVVVLRFRAADGGNNNNNNINNRTTTTK